MQVVNPTPAAIYTGIGNAISTISRAEGYMSLWRGVSSVVLGAGEIQWRNAIIGIILKDSQVRRMPCTSRHTKLLSRLWAAMQQVTTLSQQVRIFRPDLRRCDINNQCSNKRRMRYYRK